MLSSKQVSQEIIEKSTEQNLKSYFANKNESIIIYQSILFFLNA